MLLKIQIFFSYASLLFFQLTPRAEKEDDLFITSHDNSTFSTLYNSLRSDQTLDNQGTVIHLELIWFYRTMFSLFSLHLPEECPYILQKKDKSKQTYLLTICFHLMLYSVSLLDNCIIQSIWRLNVRD